MRTALLVLTTSVAAILPSAVPAGPPLPQLVQLGSAPSAEEQALRALGEVAGEEPDVESLQRAAAAEADRVAGGAEGYAGRSRLAALLPRFTAEYKHDDATNRVVGLQGSGEVDYLRLTPSDTFLVRATWELPSLVASPGELSAASQQQARARLRAEAVERVTKLYFDRRRLRVALLLAPPADPVARAQAEIEIARLASEINVLIGNLARRRAP